MIFTVVNITLSLMMFASKSTLSLNTLKILRPKDTKNLTNLHKKFCEFPPWSSLLRLRKSCFGQDRIFLYRVQSINHNHDCVNKVDEGSISPAFYKKFLRAQIPKDQKILLAWLHFYALRICARKNCL